MGIDGENAIPRPEPGLGCWSTVLHRHHRHAWGWITGNTGSGRMAHQHKPGQQQIRQHSGTDHQHALGNRTVAKQIRIIQWNGMVVVVVIRERNEAAQWQQPQGIGDAVALGFQQRWTEAHGKAVDADALQTGGQKMTCLMNHDQQPQSEQ